MSVEKDLQAYLAATLTSPPSIFIGGFRGTTDLAITVITQPGIPSEIAMGMTVVMRKTSVQVIARGTRDGVADVEVLMASIHALLEAAGTTTMNSVVYDKIVALGEPGLIDYDENGRPLWGATYHFWRAA